MTRTNKRRHEKVNNYYEYRRNAYDQHYGNVYYIDQPPLPPPYYSQLPPPYYYAAQDGGRSALPLNHGYPPLRNSFYAKRPVVQVNDSEKSRVPRNRPVVQVSDSENSRESRNGARQEKRKIRDSGKDKGTDKVIKKVSSHDKQSKPRDKQKLSLLKRISNGITHGLETFFYK